VNNIDLTHLKGWVEIDGEKCRRGEWGSYYLSGIIFVPRDLIKMSVRSLCWSKKTLWP